MFTEILQGLRSGNFLSRRDRSASSGADDDTVDWSSQNQYRKLGR